MTENHKNIDERRNHRITSNLSDRENDKVQEALSKSTINNMSQFIRHQLLISIDEEAKFAIVVPQVNKDLAIEMANCVSALNRLIALLEEDALSDEIQSDEIKLENINKVIKYVNDVDKAAWMLAHFFRGDIQRKHVIQNMALIALTSEELLEIAAISIDQGGEEK